MKLKTWSFMLAVCFVSVSLARAQDAQLVAAAKKEGKVVWYTAMAGGSYKDLARAFEASMASP